MKGLRFSSLVLLALAVVMVAPVRADGWFPRINSRGEIVSGFGTIEVLGRVLEGGWGPQWLTDDVVIYGAVSGGTVTYNVRTGERNVVGPQYSKLGAGANTFVGNIAAGDIPLHRYVGGQMVFSTINAGSPMVSPSGHWGYVTDYQSNTHRIIVDGREVASGPVVDVALSDRALVYTLATSTYTRRTMAIVDGRQAVDTSIFDWEGPTVCDGPDGPWVLSVTQKGIAFRPVGATSGFYWRGDHFNPSCAFVNGQFIIAFSSARGELGTYTFLPTAAAPRVSYSDVKDDCSSCAPAPSPAPAPTPSPAPPTPQPEPVPQVDCGAIPVAGQKLLLQLATKYSDELRSPDDEIRRAWAMKAAQQLAFSLSPDWGTKRAGEGRPLSKDSVARVIAGRLCNWDLVNGSTRALTFGHGEDITGQVFVSVTPKDWTAGGPPPPTDDPRLAELEAKLAAANADIADLKARLNDVGLAKESAERRIGELETERDALKTQLGQTQAERDDARAKLDHVTCTARVETPWARSLGARASCTVNR